MSRILMVEDDKLVAKIYQNKLTSEGFEVEIAPDGEAGFGRIDEFQPDVVILDLMLPKISGLDLLTKIRGQANHKRLPIIVFSNTYLSNMVQEAWKAGATKCLSKANCNPKQLISVIRGLLPKSGAPVKSVETPTPVEIPKPAAVPISAPAAEVKTIPGPKFAPAAPAAIKPPPAAPEPTGIKLKMAASATPLRRAPVVAEPQQDSDAALHAVLRRSLLESLPETLITARKMLQVMARPDQGGSRAKLVQELCGRMHSLAGSAGIAGLSGIAQVAEAFEALLKELYEKPQNINSSTMRTVALVIDFLGVLFERAKQMGSDESEPPTDAKVLVVDDEALSRRAVIHALEKVKLPSVAVDDPNVALEKLSATHFDLVFLDVDMPGMNGFELCTKLRALPLNKTTPVIFVSALNDFDSRANSMMSGGNDLIAKPFLFMELGLKALVYILRGRLGPATQPLK